MVIPVNNKSIWNKDNSLLNLKNNEFDNKTDILIIGGGITGLTLAYFLKDTNDKVMLIDKSKIANGITSKTTAKINYLQGIIYQTLIKKFSFNVAKLYYDSQIDAINIIKSIIKENNISCNLEQVDSIIFTLENKGVSKIYEEKKILESFNYLKAYTQTIFVTHNPYYIKIKGIKYGIFKDKENEIHTIKLICPHMKCSLIFNKEENTWDCPCHGSRFNLDGILLEGPATNNLEDRSLRK